MYAMYYNRFTGWLWFTLGAWGLIAGGSDYIQFTRTETMVALAVGLLSMLGTRFARRNQVILCSFLATLYASWMVVGSNPSNAGWVSTTPLEWLIRFLCVAWGVYCTVLEIWLWRKRALQLLN